MVGANFVKFDVTAYRVQSLVASHPSVEDRMARAVELAAAQKMWDHVHGATCPAGAFPNKVEPTQVNCARALPPPRCRLWVARCPCTCTCACTCVAFSALVACTRMIAAATAAARHRQPLTCVRASGCIVACLRADFRGLRSQEPKGHVHIYFLKVDAAWYGGFACLHLRVRTVPPARTPLGTPCAVPPVDEHKLVLEGVLTNLSPESPIELFDANMSKPLEAVHDHGTRMRKTGAAR